MNYQGEQVNFSQTSMTQYNTANIERINKSMYEYPQQIGLASEKSDSDIWKWLGMYVNGTSGENSQGSWGANQNAIMPKLDRAVNKNNSQDESIMNNKMQIEAMNERLSRQVVELGNSLKGHSDSPHNQGGGGGITQYIPLMAVGGIAAYLLKGKLK